MQMQRVGYQYVLIFIKIGRFDECCTELYSLGLEALTSSDRCIISGASDLPMPCTAEEYFILDKAILISVWARLGRGGGVEGGHIYLLSSPLFAMHK